MTEHSGKFYKKLDLPIIPRDILPTIDDVKGLDGLFVTPTNQKFMCADAPEDISDHVNSFFDEEMIVGVQAILDDLQKHSDYGLKGTKIIYNYELGGDNVTTEWYDKDSNIIEQVIFEPHTWYELDIETPHSVSGITGTRMALQVKRQLAQVSSWDSDPKLYEDGGYSK